MSSTEYIARLDIAGEKFYFSRFRMDDGWPATVPRAIEIAMRAQGTDFERFREDGFVFDPWSADSFESIATMADAIRLRSNYLAVRQAVGELTVLRGGTPYRLRHCKVRAVDAPVPRSALTVGFGAGTNDLAAVYARWTFQFTDVPE